MIVTSKFIYYHLPRTGGTAFAKLCHEFLDRQEIQYEEQTFSWMVPKDFDNGLLDVITFRSLPSWIMSYNLSQYRVEDYDQKDLGKIEEVRENTIEGKILYQDQWYYVDEIYGEKLNCIDLSNTIVIRQENLLQDFDKMLQSLYGTSTEGHTIEDKFNKLIYPKFMLDEENVDTMYNSNPIWKKLEGKIYYES